MSKNLSEYLSNKDLVDMLLAQKKQNDSLIDAMNRRIELLEDELHTERQGGLARHMFFTEKHPELIPEYVSVVIEYCEDKDSIVNEVDGFHDEAFDLSTIPELKKYFNPWK